MASFVGSRALGLVRDVVIGAQFGTSRDLDLYRTAFVLPDTIFNLVAGGALGSALVPVFASYLSQGNRGRLLRLASSVANLVLLAALGAAAAAAAAAPWLLPTLFPGFEPEAFDRLVQLVRVMLVQPVLFGVAEVARRLLNVHQHFLLPALAPLLYNLSIIGAAIGLGPSLGTLGLAVGVVAGAALYLGIQLAGTWHLQLRYLPVLDLRDEGVWRIVRLMAPRVLGQAVLYVNFIVIKSIASFLPPGSIAALDFAAVVMMMPLGVFAMALADAAFPTLATQVAERRLSDAAATLRRTLASTEFFVLPSAVALLVAGGPVVAALFQRGAFDAGSTAATAWALTLYAIGLPAHAAVESLTRAFYAFSDTRTPVLVGAATIAANVALALILVGPLLHGGLALSLSAATTVEAVALLWLLHRRLPQLGLRQLAVTWAKAALASSAMAIVLAIVNLAAGNWGWPPVPRLALLTFTGGAAYLASAWVLRAAELREALWRRSLQQAARGPLV